MRGRFEEPLDPVVARFNSSIGFDWELLPYDLIGSRAHVRMLGQVGIISPSEMAQLVAGLDQIEQAWRTGEFQPDPAWEDVHSAVETRLTVLLGDVGKKLHTARSRNDQVATDLRLYTRDHIQRLLNLLQQLQAVLVTLAEAHQTTLIPAYTHLQRAQPVSLAHHWLAYFEMFDRDRTRLVDCNRRLDVSPLGSGALAGTTLPIDRAYTAELLGFARPSANSLDAVSDRDYVVELLSALSLILTHLSRLSEELILWSSQEFGFISLTDSCATGSSLMPQKKNPDVPELIRGKTGRVFGHLLGMLTTLKGLPLAYNKDLQEDKEALFDAVRTSEDCLRVMAVFLEKGMVIRTERLAQAVTEDYSNATDAADYLVRQGIPFREAYQVIGALVRTALADGKLLQDLTLTEWQAAHPGFSEDIYAAIQPAQVVNARNSYGGTGLAQVRQALLAARARLAL
ncbi:argininosuccinate lyase [Candidatus Cyanaurora vandensis]|uniref:argininosuccinate lyase n=1 Tax=Candidatus Cyanaurora vandensis TaxID=2714958 RepID=UPI00257C64DC|nr:argininosuccinate lyase [Candidatus Cyanaurora vandensis]